MNAGGNAYVVGTTTSLDFPRLNAVQDTNVPGLCAFATKLTHGVCPECSKSLMKTRESTAASSKLSEKIAKDRPRQGSSHG